MTDRRERKRHSPEQVIAELRQADATLASGASIGQVCQRPEVSEQTHHRSRTCCPVRSGRLGRSSHIFPVKEEATGCIGAMWKQCDFATTASTLTTSTHQFHYHIATTLMW